MPHERIRNETARVEIFSDSVFAISITLLGLALKVPSPGHGSLLRALASDWPSFLAFVTSFVTIGIVWINHHRLFTHIRGASHGLLLWNGLLLMAVSLIPFTTDLVAAYVGHDGARTATAVYAASHFFVTVSFNLLWRHATRRRRLVDQHLTSTMVHRINVQYGFGPVLYLVSLCIAFASALASIILDIAFAAFFALPAFTVADAGKNERSGVGVGGRAGSAAGLMTRAPKASGWRVACNPTSTDGAGWRTCRIRAARAHPARLRDGAAPRRGDRRCHR